MISTYFAKIKTDIERFSHIVENYQINEKVYSPERGFIEGEIWFTDESRLDFAEVKDIELSQKIKYQYHYMDSENHLIFRYDNAKHHPEIKTFPHHKHLFDTMIESYEPELYSVLKEIENKVIKN